MLNKIFGLFLVLSAFVVGFFLWYGYAWLSSIGDPRTAFANYGFYTGLSTTILWIASIVLLALSHGILWSSRSGWAFWTTYIFFAAFTIVDSFVLSPTAFQFRQANFSDTESKTFSYLVGAGLLILFGLIVLANQFSSLRIHDWMYPPRVDEPTEPKEEEVSEET